MRPLLAASLSATLSARNVDACASLPPRASTTPFADAVSRGGRRSPREILKVTPDFIQQLGLGQSLTPSRSNGFLNMLLLMQKKTVRLYAASQQVCANANPNPLAYESPPATRRVSRESVPTRSGHHPPSLAVDGTAVQPQNLLGCVVKVSDTWGSTPLTVLVGSGAGLSVNA